MIDLEFIITMLVICILLFIALVIVAIIFLFTIIAIKDLLNLLAESIHKFIGGYTDKKDVI